MCAKIELFQYLKSIDDRESHMTKLQGQLEQYESEKVSYERELGSSMASQLTPAEHDELNQLNMKIQESAKKVDDITNRRIDVEKRKTRIETLLRYSIFNVLESTARVLSF